jgi:nicotinamidase-related amidase
MSACEGTPLDIVLRDCGVRSYLIAGVATEVGIEPTVRHSADLGYVSVVVPRRVRRRQPSSRRARPREYRFAGDAIIADTDELCARFGAAPRDVSRPINHYTAQPS